MTSDATHVTGSPALMGGPRVGDVLAERYELLEAIDHEGPSLGFRALDQETERPVLVRILTPPGLHTDTCDEVVARLRGMVGVGGRFLSTLLDADRTGRTPFTVEPFPSGTQLSSILDGRRARGELLGVKELLPVVARLAAALDAVPRGWRHGEVRAERVWLDTDSLKLTGPYLLPALPFDEVRDRMRDLGPGEVAYPMDVRAGRTSTSADRWGVAAIAWEALTGRSAEAPGLEAGRDEVDAELREVLFELLMDDPAPRPRDLTDLLSALGDTAGLLVPQLDPEPHAPPSTAQRLPPGHEPSAKPPPTAVAAALAGDTRVSESPAGRESDKTKQVSMAKLKPAVVPSPRPMPVAPQPKPRSASPDDTAPHTAIVMADDDGSEAAEELDPRLVRAALAPTEGKGEVPESDAKRSRDSLDPRLVRAALGVTLESSSENVTELSSDLLEIVEEVDPPTTDQPQKAAKLPRPAASRPPPKPHRPQARGASPPQPQPALPAAPGPSPRSVAGAATSPKGVKPAPAQAASVKPQGKSASARKTAKPGKPPEMAEPPELGPSSLFADQTPPNFASKTVVQPRRKAAKGGAWLRGRKSGLLIVVGALILAVLIVGAAFLLRSQRAGVTTPPGAAEPISHCA